MEDDNKKMSKGGNNQFAMIWNYYNHVDEVKNYFGGAASKDDLAETDADKLKRQELLRTNMVLKVDAPANDKGIDILKLFRFIQKYFVDDISHKYEWYALRRFLDRNKLLQACDNVAFAKHMNQKEWFAHAKKSCEANEMNTYNFLLSTAPDNWPDCQIPYGSKATTQGLKQLYKSFHALEDNKKEISG